MIMAPSVPKSDGTASSRSSILQEPHEQTPLLQSDSDVSTSNTSTGRATSQHSKHSASIAESEDGPNVSEIDNGKKDRKVGTGMVGVISVLLLGMLYSIRSTIYSSIIFPCDWQK